MESMELRRFRFKGCDMFCLWNIESTWGISSNFTTQCNNTHIKHLSSGTKYDDESMAIYTFSTISIISEIVTSSQSPTSIVYPDHDPNYGTVSILFNPSRHSSFISNITFNIFLNKPTLCLLIQVLWSSFVSNIF